MAQASNKVRVEKVVKVNEVPYVNLELTENEAQFLVDFIGTTVTGNGKRSRRKYADSIFYALMQGAGIEYEQMEDLNGVKMIGLNDISQEELPD